ncbi:transporter substrate-binding domain-containing protein [Pseudorhodoplanes sinuspersici]|uniref:Amino acid ABC transporter substrate-binding protein n=1 Tax=Pseudorhodoplanes sinuspersici TaxID=1235591 RepID=A0A1W6ZUK0_9HYPH|nr:transporter substrate-binding domain-containing protein [Pseudorhodoplanes sinuspersici]ARQ01109.1 amino acid ABC transporter substrate-binding protein [Pseudorhodoplanes sinuspersici]RKE72758.1 amino acid ABC transporter substrate-binding protein (PAAT family) [Pseudorhodoplanes sinuspersici]
MIDLTSDGGLQRAAVIAVVSVLALIFAREVAQAQDQFHTGSLPHREFLVGTKEAPPFAMKSSDGQWTGISIDLWRRIAQEKNLRYRFVEEETVQGLVDGIAEKKFDIAVAALTVTAAREDMLDFTAPFYATGLGIAVAAGGIASWTPVLRALTSFSFLQAVLALIGLALVVGLVVWFLERRHNEEFGGTIAKGLSSSVWWTTVAMTQRGIGHAGPRTMPGRFVAMLWMVGSIIAIAVFTAGITSALTIRHLQGNVQSVTDLSKVRVGMVASSSTEEVLDRIRVSYKAYPNAKEGLQAIRRGEIDAFVYDRPLLAWIVNQDFRFTIHLLDVSFDPQHYALALPPGSPLRKPLNIAILKSVQSSWWDDVLYRYMGSR